MGGIGEKVHLFICQCAVASCLLIGSICDAWSKPRPSATCRAEVETVDLCTWYRAVTVLSRLDSLSRLTAGLISSDAYKLAPND